MKDRDIEMDLYLYEENVTERLITEWKKYGSLVVAYDFDNTVYDYHKEGHSYEYVIQLLREAKNSMHTLWFIQRDVIVNYPLLRNI